MTELKARIQQKLADFASGDLRAAALGLLETMGYSSEKTADLGGSPETFLEHFDTSPERKFNREKGLFDEWRQIHLLFQLADDDLSGEGNLFAGGEVEQTNTTSYLFFAVELTGKTYTRGRLAQITRQINRLFPMPVMVLFKVAQASSLPFEGAGKSKQDACATLSIAVINRRRNKIDDQKDVLGKVTLIQGIDLKTPHRGHLDILASFTVPELRRGRVINSFDALHAAWEEVFNVELLNKRFYRKIQEWFFWAVQSVQFPHGGIDDAGQRNRIAMIRLLTRVIFCWFAREKGLLPASLFEATTARKVLKDFSLEPLDQSAIENQKSIIISPSCKTFSFRHSACRWISANSVMVVAIGGETNTTCSTTTSVTKNYFAIRKTSDGFSKIYPFSMVGFSSVSTPVPARPMKFVSMAFPMSRAISHWCPMYCSLAKTRPPICTMPSTTTARMP